MPTNLRAGQVAIVGYNAEDTNSPNKDTISFILLTPILSGTQIFFTDRAWNGTTFAAAGGGDGTYTYTAGADLPAGTVISIAQANFPAGMSLADTGETIYVYQGANANSPSTFLFAADIADSNNVFNGSLVNTGLSTAANTAVAIAFDNASFAARGHDINTAVLLNSIADQNDWTGNDNSMQVAPQGSLSNAPDQEIWVAASGGGNALIRMDRDGVSYTAEDIIHLLQNSSVDDGGNITHRLWHPTDIVFDTVHNKMFVANSDAGGHNQIVQFNISDFLANPGVAPQGTILYQDANVGVGMVGIQVDINTGHIYYGEDTHIYRLNYDTGGQTPGIVAYLGTNIFVQDFVLDLDINGNGSAYIVNSSITASFGTDTVSRNFIYQVTGITPSSTTGAAVVNATQMAMEDNDTDITGVLSTNADPEAFPKERGVIKGIDLDPVTHILYFTTQNWSADHDNNSGTPTVTQFGGIWSYATIGNAIGHYASVFRQDGVNGPDGLIYYIEIDHATGKYYISDTTGGPGVATDDQDIWVGNIAGGTPTQFGLAANIQGLTGLGISIQTAPTLGGTNLNPGQAEQANNPSPNGNSPAPPVVTPANAFTASDLDTIGAAGGDNVAGAQVRVSNNFLSNAVAGDDHQDILSIASPTSGTGTNGTVVLGGDTISFVYDAATGTMTLSGISTFANYQTVLAMVRFQATGDNPTGFGGAALRTISYSTFDGLLYSDEVHATVTVTGLNDTPVNLGLTGSYSATEDTNFALTGISVTDVNSDPANQNVVVTLSVAHGTLTILTNVANGIIAGQITAGANNSASMTLTATQNQINATLAAANGLVFVPTADYNGSDGITVVTNDQGLNGTDPGLTGTSGNEQDSDTKTINIAAVPDIVNDARSVGEDSGANNFNGANSLLANDTFENPTRFISAVTQGTHGSVAINDSGTSGDKTDDFVVYTVTDANYNGSDSFTYTVTSPTGVTEVATVTVTVVAANDPVTGAAPVSTSLSEDSVNFAVTGLSISDIDSVLAPAGVYNVTLSSTHGTMTLTTLTGLTFSPGSDGTADATMTFHGTLAAINTALATATYTPTANYNGTDAAGIVLQVTDTFGGIVATGTGAATSDTDNISVTVTPVNDAPTFAALNGTPTFVEGAAAIVLDNDATATDIDLTATNYTGATLTLARSGAASAQDVFAGTGGGSGLTLTGSGSGNVDFAGTIVGTYTQSGGTLTITFNSSATQALVNSTLRGITYSNNSDNPPTSVAIAYVFSDGNSGVQGPGGPLTAIGSVTVAITPTNDAPTAILSNPTLGPATEQTTFNLKAQGLSVSDIDGNSGSETVTLAVGQGTLTVTAGTSGAVVSGSPGGSVTITGTIAQINALLNTDPTSTVSYLNGSDAPATSTSLTLTIHDNGATGSGDLFASSSGTISISAVNDAPTNTKPGTQTINEDGTLTFSGGTAISVSDPDVGAGTLTVTLSVVHGQLTLSGTSGLTFALGGGDGTDDATMTFTGTQTNVNAALAGLLYEPNQDFNGSDTLTITTDDNGNTGTPGAIQDIDTVTINLTAVNDAPTIGDGTESVAAINEDTPNTSLNAQTVSQLFGPQFSDAADQVAGGSSANTLLGIAIVANGSNGNGTWEWLNGAVWTAIGSASLGAARTFTAATQIRFNPTLNFNGPAPTLTAHLVDNSTGTITNGNTVDISAVGATGGTTRYSGATVLLSQDVTAVNDGPVNTVPLAQTINEDGSRTFSSGNLNAISVADVDASAGTGILTVTLAVAHGTLTLNGVVGLDFTGGTGDGTADATMTFSGTASAINTALNGLVYTPTANFNGSDTLTVTTNDNGNTGTPSALQDSDSITINITAVNDAPTVAGDGTESAATIAQDTPSPTGQSDSALFGGQYSDALDNQIPNGGASSPGAFSGVAVTVNDNSGVTGQWQYFDTGTSAWVDFGAVSDASALLIGQGTAVRFNPAAGFTGSAPTVTVHLVDNSLPFGITFGQHVDISSLGATGGSTAYSIGTVVLSEQVVPPGNAPVVDLDTTSGGIDATATFLEGNGSVALGPTILVSDDDGDMIHGATIAISGAQAGDILVASLPFPGGITIDVGSSTASVMVLTGTATVEQYTAALGQIGFDNTSDDPTVGGTQTSRTITVTVNDGLLDNSPAAISHVTVFGVNDEPTLAATGLNPVLIENGAAVDLFSAVTASTVETNQTLTSLTLTVTNVTDGASEILAIDGSTVALTNGSSVTTATHGLSVGVTVSGSTATVTFSGATLSAADVQTLVDGLTYVNTSENPTDADRLVTITQLVDSGSNASPNDNTHTLAIGSTVNVNPVNDAAIITGPATGSVTEAGGINNGTAGTPTATGNLDAADVDNATDAWQPVVAGAATLGGYGTYALSAAGVWVYTLNDNNAAVQALLGAATLTDTFNALTADGTAQLVTITIHAQDDAPTPQPDAVTTDEATVLSGNVLLSNGSGADSDPDSGGAISVSAVNGSGASVGMQIGLASGALLKLNADGTFTYDPNHAFDATPTAGSGAANAPAHDSFTYTLTGGSSTTVSVSINGLDSNDRIFGTGGVDHIFAGIGNDEVYGMAGADVLGGGDGNDFINGDGDSDQLYGDAGNDFLVGEVGDDQLYGQAGDDRLEGREGSDLLDGGIGDDRLFGGDGDDHLVGGDGNDQLAGDANDDLLEGGSGNDLLDGGDGDDRVFGGTGADYLFGGLGNDRLYGEDNADTIGGGDGDDLIEGGDGADLLYGDAGNDLVRGGLGSDQLYGQAGADRLEGGSGDDLLDGGTGNDLLFGGDGFDHLVGGAGADQLSGEAADDLLDGGDGDDVLDGGLGADHILGGTGADYLVGGDGNDQLYGNENEDTIGGGDGNDLIDGGTGADHLYGDAGADYIVGGDGDDFIFGQDDDDIIGGQNGNDVIDGGAGADKLYGDDGNDTIAGGVGNDQLYGQLGNDSLDGGDGNDLIDGGFGNDLLTGGIGADSFLFTTTPLGIANTDQIADFEAGIDKLVLDHAVFDQLVAGSLPSSAFVVGTAANDADDRIIYDQTTGNLYYDADGNGAGAAVQFANLSSHPVITASDFQVI